MAGGSVPKETYLEDIKRVATELGRPPNTDEYNTKGTYSTAPTYRLFVSCEEALEEADLDPTNIASQTNSGHLQKRSSDAVGLAGTED